MTRALFVILLVGAAMFGIVWVADHPGTFRVEWLGEQIEGEVWRLVVVIFAAMAVLVALVAVMLWIFRLPGRLRRWHADRRRARGYTALTRGLVAVAAGDTAEAIKHAGRAEALLHEPPLTLLLSAQAAQLADDGAAARRYFAAMLDRPETAFLGLRGLITQALKSGDEAEALKLARRARGLRPDTPWLLTTILELETRAGTWTDAAASAREAGRVGAMPQAQARRAQAAALLARARDLLAAGKNDEARAVAEQAQSADAGHPAAAQILARALIETDKTRRALKLIEAEWARSPHPELAALWRRVGEGDAIQVYKHMERLAAANPDHVESRLMLGLAALDAKLWGEARRFLDLPAGAETTAGRARAMARLEAEEKGDLAAERRWLARAADAAPDPAWVCGRCGYAHGAWRATCQRCHAFDSLGWRSPDRVQPILTEAKPGLPAKL